MSDDHLIHRPARLTCCLGCGNHVLPAIEYGRTVTADPESLSIGAEIAARLEGRTAYDVITGAGRIWLEHRGYMRVIAGRKFPVVADHECRNPHTALGARMELIVPPGKAPARKPGKIPAPVTEEVPF